MAEKSKKPSRQSTTPSQKPNRDEHTGAEDSERKAVQARSVASEDASRQEHPTASNGRMLSIPEEDIRGLLQVLLDVQRGEFSSRYVVDSDGILGRVADTLNDIITQNEQLTAELARVREKVGEKGRLSERAVISGFGGGWRSCVECVNELVDDLVRPITEVERVIGAVAQGDLSQTIDLEVDGKPVQGEFRRTANTVNTMVDRLSSFASEVTRVAREVGTEGRLGGQAKVKGVSGTWKDLTDNVNSMADNLTTQVRSIAEVTTAVATGNLTKKITVDAKGEIAELKNTINTMVDQLSSFASEVTRVAREVGTEGKLGGQAEVEGVSGTWKDLTDNVNSMADNLTTQVRGIAEVTTAVANGDLTKKISVDAKGEIAELKNTINTMVDQLSSFASEVIRVAREVGTEGKLGGQAKVEGVSGTWRDLTDNVNSMADNLTTQVRGIAEVTTAVATGDLTKKITVEAKGEIAELKNTINTMVDQLSSFASEVTRVAREVGTEGRLGGQARVEGVSGTWKDLTDNVNSMADNLTTQVRSIADVTTAVANGNLTKKITVDAKGEIAELKNTINTMVDQLSSFASEVTRVAREVGTEGKLGGQARVEGVSGTWKDLTDNVNSMANNLTTQVRGIADVVTAVARGNLKRKLSLEAKGEIAELADTINNMIDTLATFADQVTTVAREVGVEGKLGGQAEVPGASGTWRDLVDNVNQLAANLTTQVRAITEVTTAVAAGDLTKKITVEAAGEVADLKDNVNEMIRNLKETTRKNTEQDWLKTNLAKFTQLLQGQKDLKTVSKLVLSELAPLINVQHGTFYIADQPDDAVDGEPEMKLLATYAYVERKNLANRFKLGEGLVGQCALEKERILLSNVPPDYVRISSGLGEASPYNIVVLPVLFEGQVKAVIELASFSEIKDTHLSFLDQLTESIGIVLNTLEANMRTEQLLAQSQKQQEELFYTNQRLEEKAQSLQKSEEMLKQQQEELQQTNRELEEKARLLADQKEEVEQKNREIELARRALQEKAEQLALTSKYKSEFLANMSHELRTPLNSMLILSKMLAENKEGSLTAKQVEYAETIYSSGADLLGLINEILDLSKIESGAMAVEASDVALDGVAEDLQNLFQQVAREKGLDFQISIEEDLPKTIFTDRKRLQQVLKNLISNGLKFTDEGHVRLDIRSVRPGETFERDVLREVENVIAFSVIDTGRGVSPEKQQIIFEAFQQAETGDGRSAAGTGLGLSISREIARLLGGELHLESTPGEGSTFTFYLPFTYVPTKLARKDGGDGEEPERLPGGIEIPAFINTPSGMLRRSGDNGTEQRTSPSTPDGASSAERVTADEAEPGVETATTEPEPAAHEGSGDGAIAESMAVDERMVRAQVVPDDRDDIGPDDRVLLVVEDDPNFARIIAGIAHDQDFKVINAMHAEEGMRLAKRYKPNAITLDIKLSGAHGLVLLDQLKNDPATRHIPVTILSVVEKVPRHQRKGALSQISKPVSREEVDASLTQMKAFSARNVKDLLIIEDDEAEQMGLSGLLEGEDVNITSVRTGQEAIRAVQESHFDCAIIDLGLPDIDGVDLLRKIRAELGASNLPVIVHTGKDLDSRELQELNDLADAVVAKDVRSLDRLLHETSIFLHRIESQMPEEARRRLVERDQSEISLVGKKVLIVDDDIRNIFAVTSLLERHGMDIIYAESGQEGLDQLRKHGEALDAVLMDIMMPGMDGYETTRAIRQMPLFKDLPVIAVTAKAMKGDREKCIDAGASDYITKPVNVEQLISILRLWIAN